MTKSIFDDSNKMSSKFFQFKTIGDKIEGTLVDKRIVMNKMSGKEQILYELKTKDDEYMIVGGKPGIDMQMKRVKLGQVVGFEFVSEKPNPGLSATKIIQVYANKDIVDEEWVEEQDEISDVDVDVNESFPSSFVPESQVGKESDGPQVTVDKLLEDIRLLAATKLGVNDKSELKQMVMESTGLAFIDANLGQIKESLEGMEDKK